LLDKLVADESKAAELRDQLKNANLLSKKDAKRLAHEERVDRKAKGREGVEAERTEREAELQRKREQDRERDRERQSSLEAQRQAAQERAACEAILETEVRAPSRGRIGWLFELADGRIPMLRIGDAELHQLQGGNLCVVRTRDGDAHIYGFLNTPHARRVQAQLPERIVWAAPGALAS